MEKQWAFLDNNLRQMNNPHSFRQTTEYLKPGNKSREENFLRILGQPKVLMNIIGLRKPNACPGQNVYSKEN